MSRSNRAPRKDIALLRKLKDPNFSPSSLLEDGSAQQKERTNASSVKTEWLLAQQQLQEERDTCEKELMQTLSSLAANHKDDIPDVQMCLMDFSVCNERVKAERLEYKGQVKDISSVTQSLKAYGRADFKQDAAVLKEQIEMLKEDLTNALEQLSQ
jgi:hypothetical protein